MKRARKMISRVFKVIKKEEMRILPGQLAFFMILAVFSIFPLLGLISSSFISTELVNSLEENLPVGVYTVLESLLDVGSTGSIIIFVTICIYFASDGCLAMIITSNVIYKIKNSNYLKQKIKSFFMTFFLIFLILFIVIVPAFGDLIIDTIAKNFPGKLIDTIDIIYNYLKLPISFILIFLGIKILYTLAPDDKIPSHYNNHGTLFTTVLWIIITKIYSIYLNSFNTYNIFYGSLANVVILFFWMYLLAFVFTMGMGLNYDSYIESKKLPRFHER